MSLLPVLLCNKVRTALGETIHYVVTELFSFLPVKLPQPGFVG